MEPACDEAIMLHCGGMWRSKYEQCQLNLTQETISLKKTYPKLLRQNYKILLLLDGLKKSIDER